MNIKPTALVLMGVVTLTVLAQARVARAAEIKLLCSNGIKAVMEELIPQFERATKHEVVVRHGVSAVLKRQIEAGERFDIAVLTPPLIDDLVKQGKIAGDTRATLARSGMALAIRAGATKPDIRTIDALKRTLLSSKSIIYTREGASGVFFAELVQRLDLAEALKSKLKVTTSGEEVGASVARGEAELGVLPVSEILPVRGVELLGTFPSGVQGYVVMVAGVSPGAAQSAAAKELIRFLTSPAALPVIEKRGMERGWPALGQEPKPRATSASSAVVSDPAAELLAFEREMEAAVVRGDVAFLDRVCTSDFSFTHGDGWTTGGPPLRVENKAQWLASVGKAPYLSRELDSVQVELHGDIAITYGRYRARNKVGEPGRREFTVWFERVYTRRSGHWQYVSHRTVHGPTYSKGQSKGGN